MSHAVVVIFRACRYVGSDPYFVPLPDRWGVHHHRPTRKHPSVQHTAHPHDTHHPLHARLGELRDSTTAAVGSPPPPHPLTEKHCL